MDLTTMRTAVRTRLGVPSADTFYTDAVLTDLVNEALAAVAAEYDWPWLTVSTTFTTTGGTQAYTPPAGWTRTKALTINGYDSLEWRSLEEIREWPTDIVDVPRYFTVFDDDMLLAPVPSGTFTMKHDYLRTEPALSANGDTPLMPSQWHYSIVAYACHLAHLRQGDTNRANAALMDYAAWLKRMADQRRRQTGGLRVRVRPGSEWGG